MKTIKNCFDKIVLMMFCLLMIGYSQCGYAGVTSMEISVGCNEKPNIARPLVYIGSPDVQLSLITKGIRVVGTDSLIIDWDSFKFQQHEVNLPDDPEIVAECLPYADGKIVLDVYGLAYESMWPPNKTLVCRKGEGMSIAMYAPNDVDPNKYQYVATLIINKDEHKKSGNVITNLFTDGLKQFQTGCVKQSLFYQ